MLKRMRPPTTPGDILRAHYLLPCGISIVRFAETVGCSRKHMSNIVHGHARIEATMATRMAKVLGTTPELWFNLQNAVDLYDAALSLKSWRPARAFEPVP